MRQELFRKTIHVVTNSLIPLIYLGLNIPRTWMAILIGIISVLFVMIDFGRTRDGWLSEIFGKLFNGMLRSHELEGKLTGASYVLIGSFISIAIFPREIAVLALLFTAIGDSVAGLYGRKFGRIKIWNKTLEGSLSGFAACILITLFFPQILISIKFSGAFSAMLIELLPIKIDDNLRIPLFSGFVMVILSNLII
ncbi:MAG: diacylglycerol/polyprenol kinase family protein [Candidatus Neomarinimicrobiota bacterium]